MSDQILVAILEEASAVLNHEVSADDTLYDVGADSLALVELWGRLEERLPVGVDLGGLMSGASIRKIAADLSATAQGQ